jgi:putative SOS response-associated peptidase YedK
MIDSPGLQQLLRDLGIDLRLPGAVNIAPTEQVALVRGPAGDRELASARWWLTPSWAQEVDQKYSMFNARCETLGSSPAFRGPFRSRRGIVPMSSFIEWRQEGAVKQPWLITTKRARSRSLPCGTWWQAAPGAFSHSGDHGGGAFVCALAPTHAPDPGGG